jgi:hypothetical protein
MFFEYLAGDSAQVAVAAVGRGEFCFILPC